MPAWFDTHAVFIGNHTASQRCRRILSIDGGGIRGLSSLIILENMMLLIRQELEANDTPKPSDYFDLICGTSTGGLIAIMLGRLKMVGLSETLQK